MSSSYEKDHEVSASLPVINLTTSKTSSNLVQVVKGLSLSIVGSDSDSESSAASNVSNTSSGKLDDPQGGDTTMLMQQVREVMTVNQEMTDESSWIWLTSEQMGFPLRSEFANENHGEAGSSKQCNDQRTD